MPTKFKLYHKYTNKASEDPTQNTFAQDLGYNNDF